MVAFRPPQRASSGAPEPFVTLKSSHTTLGVPAGLAFDGDGSLWVMGISGVLSKFMISSIAASGPAEPSLQINIPDHVLLWSLAFWPKIPGSRTRWCSGRALAGRCTREVMWTSPWGPAGRTAWTRWGYWIPRGADVAALGVLLFALGRRRAPRPETEDLRPSP